MKTVFNRLTLLSALFIAALVMVSCGDDGGEETPAPIASFDFQVDADNPLMVTFTNNSKDGETFAWDFGDESGTSAEENPSYTYAEGGTFTVTLTATNEGGSNESAKEVNVIAPTVNLVEGGDMSDESAWNYKQLWVDAVDHGFVEDEFKFSSAEGIAYSNAILWQEIEVEVGETYNLSAQVRSEGTVNSWFEVYFGTEALGETADDYSSGGIQIFLKSFGEGENCAVSAFDDDIFSVASGGCPIPEASLLDANGNVTFAAENVSANGTIFLAFKAGNWDGNFGQGIFLDDVSLQKVE